MATKYLRQLKTGRIYLWTRTLSRRADMVDFDAETAELRIKAMRENLALRNIKPTADQVAEEKERIEHAADVSRVLTDLENAQEAEFQEKEKPKPDLMKADEDISDKIISDKSMTDDDIEEERLRLAMEKDADVIKIMGMNKKSQVEAYMLEQYGKRIDTKGKSLQLLKNMAIDARSERLQEESRKDK